MLRETDINPDMQRGEVGCEKRERERDSFSLLWSNNIGIHSWV